MAKSDTVSKSGTEILKIDNSTNTDKNAKLAFWQDKYQDSLSSYQQQLDNVDDNYKCYDGTRDIYNSNGAKASKKKTTVRKVAFELVESQVDSTIPLPKVTSISGKEDRAMAIENFLKNEIDRLPFEVINDEQARLTPIAGASFFHVEWDNSVKTRNTVGKLVVTNLDPKSVIPQKGVYNINEMDYIFLRLEQTKLDIKNRYGVDIKKLQEMDNTESDMNPENNTELVTHIYVYYKDKNGKIGLFSWVDDHVINDLDNYFSRKELVCEKCGQPQNATSDKCEACGSKKFKYKVINNEKVNIKTYTQDPLTGQEKEEIVEIDVPYYVPKEFPIVKRINVSKRDSFLGSSDVEAIKDQQNDLNISMTKIREKLLKGGSIVTLPEDTQFKASDEELQIVKIKNPAQKALIDLYTMTPNISTDLGFLDLTYNVARQTIGITDSYQGRQDTTATSGKAKEFSAAKAAGRFESKRVMKDFAFSELYKIMFQFVLAYADEPRYYSFQNDRGANEYRMFDKRLFIERDEDGNYFYDDEFVFACDVSSTMSTNRQLMWQETRNNFSSGAYGDPTDLGTIVMFWQMMDGLHYPGAKQALQFASQRLEMQQQMAQQQAQMQQQQQQMQVDAATGNTEAKKMDAQANLMKAKGSAAKANVDAITALLGNGGNKNGM